MWNEFYKFAVEMDTSDIHYDIPLIKYHNPRDKEKPVYRTLTEMGFPHDIKETPFYYDFKLVSSFNSKTMAHWKRKLPKFENHYLQYLLVFGNRKKAREQFYEDCNPYGISKEEADSCLKNEVLFTLEPDNAIEVIKEFIFIIYEYAPNDFGHFAMCYGLKNSFAYDRLYQTALDILQTKVDTFSLTPRVVQREVVKGTPLIEIYHNIFKNKSVIKETVKSFNRVQFCAMPVGYYQRKIERILLSQSGIDYTVNELRDGIQFDYCIYKDGEFLFAVVNDKMLFSYDDSFASVFEEDDDTPYYPEQFEVEIDKIKEFDNECLKRGILVYHISYLNLDEYDMTVAGDIRKAKKDLDYLKNLIETGQQYSSIREYFREANEDDDREDDEWY